ncbi:transcriptional regulator [Candidatus Pseudothioglobus singularis]|jgi:glycine cleavage system regulatory protein|nr:ACT domain-containing protein [Candidatus Pseudothioglobus singularis]MDP0560513.1 transcriptional regulator [Candidatus Thioglobus sp.]MDA8855208.1 transcriptional regulator [Candidatus Pseudothioglobus singularis]MDA9801759.1 transcriptional regulator [Candidatus Pseudothioglobus singularis]MDB4847443.1 transcriptional regulator [Candidatus Pseudothioglobus singularis]MDC0553465.1 transcriptional regulator [Candidatus Pseudothioglobus singularis]|tara:strand:+ start:430 stop:948 length:519 start_codon:yes stop_codon:yes gene_type:complete
MKSFLISVLGDDKSGLVDGLSKIIVANNGDWIESNMSSFEGKFAGILKVNVPSSNAVKLKKELTSSTLGLQIACEETKPVDELNNVMSYNIELIGQNHVGIINKLSHVLADELEANVEELKTEIIDASMSGEQLFKAQINLHLPNSLDENLIRDKLEQIADEMMVEIYSYES